MEIIMNTLKQINEMMIMEKFSETGTAEKVQKWIKKNNVVVVDKDFTDNFINTKSLQYSDYKTLVQWLKDENVVVVDKKNTGEMIANFK